VYDVRRGSGPTWRFRVRAYKKAIGDPQNAEPVYVIRGYAPRGRFRAVEDDLESAMNSVRLPK
jgi:hypothetical protein